MGNRYLARALVVIALSLALAACDDNGTGNMNRVTAPSAAFESDSFGDRAPFVGASVVPAEIPLVWIAGFSCPSLPPFSAHFVVVVDQPEGFDGFLTQVSFDFSERSGLVLPMVFGTTDLSAMFGTTLVPAGRTREFAFVPRFGCGFVSPPDRVGIRVSMRDRRGGRHDRTITARLR